MAKNKPAAGDASEESPEDRLLKFFAYDHLPPQLKEVSQRFHELASAIGSGIDPGPERTASLGWLLLAKDAAVRARLHPGG